MENMKLKHLALLLLLCVFLASCRKGEGEACTENDDCRLGLYCQETSGVCADRGELLKEKAAQQYVYPIPITPKGKVKGTRAVPAIPQ